jgi:thymidine kinase
MPVRISPAPKLTVPGKLTTITGPAKAGKTLHLLNEIQGFTKGSALKAQVFAAGNSAEKEHAECFVSDHDQLKTHEATLIDNSTEIFTNLDDDTSVIGIDRANLLGREILDVVQTLRARGYQVFVAGNNMNTQMQPYVLNGNADYTFGDVICISDDTKILSSKCVLSGDENAHYSAMIDGELQPVTLQNHPNRTEIIQNNPCDVQIVGEFGSINIICGPMGSNKTTTMLGEYNKVQSTAVLFKPTLDTRGEETTITDHTGKISARAYMISESEQILENIPFGTRHVFVDEFFMLDDTLPVVLQVLRARGYKVTLSGLNTDFRMQPFNFQRSTRSTGELFAIADEIDFLKSKHVFQDENGLYRFEDAGFTMRLASNDEQLQVGGFKEYQSVSITGHPYARNYAEMFLK